MPLGNILSGADQQYVGLKDETGTWRILNTWHEDLKMMSADEEIPDDSEAVTVLSEGQFIALIKEAASLGVLLNATFGTGEAELENTINESKEQTETENTYGGVMIIAAMGLGIAGIVIGAASLAKKR